MNLAKISTKVTFWSQEEQEELNSLVNRLLPREAGNDVLITKIFHSSMCNLFLLNEIPLLHKMNYIMNVDFLVIAKLIRQIPF